VSVAGTVDRVDELAAGVDDGLIAQLVARRRAGRNRCGDVLVCPLTGPELEDSASQTNPGTATATGLQFRSDDACCQCGALHCLPWN